MQALRIDVAPLLGASAAGKSVWVSYFTQAGPQRLVGTVNGNVGKRQVLLRYTYKDAGAGAMGGAGATGGTPGSQLLPATCALEHALCGQGSGGCCLHAFVGAWRRHVTKHRPGPVWSCSCSVPLPRCALPAVQLELGAPQQAAGLACLAIAAVATWFLTQLDAGQAAAIVLAPQPNACEDMDASCAAWAATGECSNK